MNKKTVNKILSETESGYDLISQKFSQTRKHFWRGLEFIKDYTREGDNVLDYGCGNGRLLELIGENKPSYHGVDVSGQLIELAKQKYLPSHSGLDPESSFNVQFDDALDSRFRGNDNNIHFQKINPVQTTLPFNEGFFNTIYSIAVFHHFPSKKYRQDMAKELYRLTADGGHIVITVWYLWQKKYFRNILRNWKNKFLGKSKLDWNDCEIMFTDNKVHPVESSETGARFGEQFNRGAKFSRFHHAWTKRELKKLFLKAGFKIERCDIPDGRNILLIAKK